MKKIYLLLVLFISFSCKQKEAIKKITYNNPAKKMIAKTVNKVGNYEQLKKLKNVEFNYTFYQPSNNKKDISVERYVFDGEISWGKYTTHQVFVFPKNKEIATQYFSEKNNKAWVKLGDQFMKDSSTLASVKFIRKANFYWFTMMQKLLDEGLTYKLLPDRKVDNIDYKIIKVGFEKNIGEVQDDFILYLNPETHLVDQFLFTVKGSKIPQPLLMKSSYSTVKGISIMTKRDIYMADWDGNIKGDILFQQVSENIKFNNNFDVTMFEEK
ncbi:hypothetical protein WH52_13350 [Tenacibaculum holothuriorum]|uniref:Uncharacterized protein n=1 Tax=Tenacibaculum holothuriorum TaxID=1635173 RepID=A0A1Y2P9C2_9FLAO|nr:hypothetical protein [Tenacibaculum holothuriorum]OSY87044.1 hypothetical protein WH52_13350 [Tenacibaculum holothuriorum]